MSIVVWPLSLQDSHLSGRLSPVNIEQNVVEKNRKQTTRRINKTVQYKLHLDHKTHS